MVGSVTRIIMTVEERVKKPCKGLNKVHVWTLGEHIVASGQGYGHAYTVWNPKKHLAWLIHKMLSMSSQTRNCISLTAMRKRRQRNSSLS